VLGAPPDYIFSLSDAWGGWQWIHHSTNGAPDLASEVIIDGVPYSQQETPATLTKARRPLKVWPSSRIPQYFPARVRARIRGGNLHLKSGTNRWHGDAFEFLRNEIFDARGFFASTRPKVRQNDFGGTVGGPIKKNKLSSS